MRILAVTHQYPPAIGGSEKYIADLSQELASRGHQVDVFTSRATDYHTWKSELGPRACVKGVNVYRFRSMRRARLHWRILEWGLNRYWRTRSRCYEPLLLFGGGPICPGMFVALLSRVGQYDLVHLNSLVYSHAAYAYRAARWRAVPVVVTPHVEIGQKVTYALGWQSRILEGSDHVIAVTQGERDFLLGQGLDPWRVTAAGNGLHVDSYPARDSGECRRRLGLPEDAFVLLFLGRQVRYKGLETVLDAYAILRRRYAHLYLVVAGPETDYSRQLFSSWQEQPGVINLGQISDDLRADVLNACDCLVLPSAGEAFGIVFLEAWIVGKPVIGPQTPAISTLIQDGRDGWLVPVNDPLAIAEVLVRWLDAPLLAQEMGVHGREKVLSHYTWPHIADIIEGVYLRTLRTRRRVRKAQVSRHVSG